MEHTLGREITIGKNERSAGTQYFLHLSGLFSKKRPKVVMFPNGGRTRTDPIHDKATASIASFGAQKHVYCFEPLPVGVNLPSYVVQRGSPCVIVIEGCGVPDNRFLILPGRPINATTSTDPAFPHSSPPHTARLYNNNGGIGKRGFLLFRVTGRTLESRLGTARTRGSH